MQDAATASALVALLQQVATAPASVLLLDYDGTLAPFHVDRNRAYPYPGVVPILSRIVEAGRTRVILLSGRPIVELRTLLASLDSIEMWGSHGMEHQSSNGSYSRCQISCKDADSLAEAHRRVASAGLLPHTEIKLGGIAIHWRGLLPAEARHAQNLALQGWTPLAEASGLKLLHFEAGLELRMAHPNKGDAVRSVLAGLSPNVPVACLGDDLTDEDAFHALGQRGLSVLVKADYRQTLAQAWIRPPQELLHFLEHWLSSSTEPPSIASSGR